MTTVNYLQWDNPDDEVRRRASELFHEFHLDPPVSLSEADFDGLYEEIIKVDTDDLEKLFAEWNRGSGQESALFRELRYCERCQTHIEGGGEAVTHAAQNHGYDAFHDPSEPDYIHGERSLSVGDIAEQDQYYVCAPIGWQELQLVEK